MFLSLIKRIKPRKSSSELNPVKKKWDDAHSKKNYKMRFAMSHPQVEEYIQTNYLDGGQPLSILKPYAKLPVDNALELACGRGDFSIRLVREGIAKNVDAYDISETAVDDARKNALSAGIESLKFHAADVNKIELEEDKYDLVCFRQSLHHIEELEHVFEQISKTLKKDGLLFVNDYVGPSRMQWTDRQMAIMNDILEVLPKSYRKLLSGDMGYRGEYKQQVHRTPVEIYLRVDPSEGVRSAEILPVAKQYFKIIDERPLAGTIHYELLRGIIHNFEVDSEKDMALLRMILLLEKELISNGVIDSDFKCFVAKH